ncbi:hypothetical protein, partial [Desulfovibrio sp. JC022]|uniref:hypothetical protein n=1 Tax=Desulfovibrio sp. JC022 TaxID=2593642 RepID=UPI00193EE451
NIVIAGQPEGVVKQTCGHGGSSSRWLVVLPPVGRHVLFFVKSILEPDEPFFISRDNHFTLI